MNIGKKLEISDTIGVIAPANFVDEKRVLKAKEKLEKLGYKVVLGESCHSKWYSFAGTDEVRANDINKMFADKDIDAIICLRGGYGCIRLLELLDYEMIKKNPKIFMGYSDITSIHGALNRKCDLITFHGPMAVSNILNDFDEVTSNSFYDTLTKETKNLKIANPSGVAFKNFKDGSAIGELVGGNLAVLVSSLGTEYDVDVKGKILFIEEIGEYSYKVDRMLNQLYNAGKFDEALGVVVGDFANCNAESDTDFSLEEVFEMNFDKINIPVIGNVQSGHCKPMLTLPFGAKVAIDSSKNYIEILENVVK